MYVIGLCMSLGGVYFILWLSVCGCQFVVMSLSVDSCVVCVGIVFVGIVFIS